ncbi:hypothetical protein ACFWBS_54535 [Streptomyces mirabilis]|uniref:hypothetical protein n=1 Tax=Streptomyces mirabilis TaxID=68239 RepID=UPI00364CF6A5
MTTIESDLVPYITARTGEEAVLQSYLRANRGGDGRLKLVYVDETPEDRDTRGVLWGRRSQRKFFTGKPIGQPMWRLVHPSRQRETMMLMRCQVAFCTAKTPDGYLFLAGANDRPTHPGEPVRIAQPPVCVEHAPIAVKLCPYLAKGHTAFLARRAPLYGVLGTRYRIGASGIEALPPDRAPLPYGHTLQDWFLASQLVRELRDYDTVDINDLSPA